MMVRLSATTCVQTILERMSLVSLVMSSFIIFLQVQRYEGASTIYGPHTLTLYLAQYRKLASALVRASIIIITTIILIIKLVFNYVLT
jgi:hypothetical protein